MPPGSMHVHRRQIILPCQNKGQVPVLNKRQPLAIGAVDRIDHRTPTGLVTHVLGQIGNHDRANIDQPISFEFAEIKRCVHETTPGYPLLIWMV